MTGKVVVITGASSGIGAALTRQLASQGHQLVIAARRESELKQVAAETGSKAIPVVTDVTRRRDLENLRDSALKKAWPHRCLGEQRWVGHNQDRNGID